MDPQHCSEDLTRSQKLATNGLSDVVNRSEYVKLQQKCNSLERENALLAAQAGGLRTQDSFVGRLVATVAALYNRPLYSDLTIRTPASSIYAHKFVLRYHQCSQGCGSGSALIEFPDPDPHSKCGSGSWRAK
jgi:hypothetical protein